MLSRKSNGANDWGVWSEYWKNNRETEAETKKKESDRKCESDRGRQRQ